MDPVTMLLAVSLIGVGGYSATDGDAADFSNPRAVAQRIEALERDIASRRVASESVIKGRCRSQRRMVLDQDAIGRYTAALGQAAWTSCHSVLDARKE